MNTYLVLSRTCKAMEVKRASMNDVLNDFSGPVMVLMIRLSENETSESVLNHMIETGNFKEFVLEFGA